MRQPGHPGLSGTNMILLWPYCIPQLPTPIFALCTLSLKTWFARGVYRL
jgi:hypothetical protein